MLTALEQGVKGGKWFTLIDKVFSEKSLTAAFWKVARNRGAAGVDHESVEGFERRLPGAIQELSTAIRHDTYRPQAVRRVHIPKPGTNETRPLGIPTVRDRVPHGRLMARLERKIGDGRLLRLINGIEMARYADDFVILRRRQKLRGRGRGRDHQRWPNDFFAERGLFSLVAAHAAAVQSSTR